VIYSGWYAERARLILVTAKFDQAKNIAFKALGERALRASAYPSAHPEDDFKVTESLENEKITYLHENSPVTYILKTTDEGTKLTYVVEYEMPWGIVGKFLAKLFSKRMGEREFERSLEKLKSILEK
jgi:hypothetical protein